MAILDLTGYFYGDSRRKNSQSAIFTATVAVKIARSLYLRRRTNSKEGAQSAIEINLNDNFKA